MTTAKNRAIDAHRREATFSRKAAVLARDVLGPEGGGPATPGADAPEVLDALDDHIGDDLLRLVFTACHPALSLESRVALTLRCLGGLSTDEIGRAFLVPETTAAQRIVRAKKTWRARASASSCLLPTSSPSACRPCWRWSTSSSTRGMQRRPVRTGCGPSSARRRCGSGGCSRRWSLTSRRCTASCPDGAAGVAAAGAHRPRRRARPAARPGPPPWDRLLVRRGLESLDAPSRCRGRSVPTPSRPASPPAMPAPPARRTPTGRASRPSTRSSSVCGPRRSCS